MTKITVLIWNVETFGQNPKHDENLARSSIIGLMAKATGANIIIMQELKPGGIEWLPSTAAYLTNCTPVTWKHGWIPAGITEDIDGTQRSSKKSRSEGLEGVVNREGYAVLYVDGLLEQFTRHDTGIFADEEFADKKIGLCIQIVDWDAKKDRAPTIMPTKNYLAGLKHALFPKAGELLFTTAGKKGSLHSDTFLTGFLKSDYLLFYKVRRPAVIKVKNGNAPIFVLVYHAPSAGFGARMGTSLFCCLPQLHNIKVCPQVIAAGDLNITSTNEIDESAKAILTADPPFTRGTWNSSKNEYDSSMVHYATGLANKRTLLDKPADVPQLLGSPRDVLFYRLERGVFQESGVFNALDALVNTSLGAEIRADRAVQKYVKNYNFPKVVENDPTVHTNFKALFDGNNSGNLNFPNLFNAALFYRIFVSDHLPLRITFNVG
ncbi:MAG: hypothetical protein KTR23_03240 [Rhodospirillales bacterium]|nr:hypothetical protein [Rhodospirillales bacterium]